MPCVYPPGAGPAERGRGVAGAGDENLPGEHGHPGISVRKSGPVQGGAAGNED